MRPRFLIDIVKCPIPGRVIPPKSADTETTLVYMYVTLPGPKLKGSAFYGRHPGRLVNTHYRKLLVFSMNRELAIP